MQWQTHGRRPVYRSEWVELWLDDVSVPGGDRFEHHVLRFPRPSVTVLAVRDEHVLMLWRHRFITDTWGWEVPAGSSEPDDASLEDAARRELEEETGWRAGCLQVTHKYFASNGISDQQFTCFLGTDLEQVGEPRDRAESTRVEWLTLRDAVDLVRRGEVTDGPTLTAISYYLGVWRTPR